MPATSISDYESYRNVCAQAATWDHYFDKFRSNDEYKAILEHTTPELAAKYIECVVQQSPHLFKYLETFRMNDRFGSPEKTKFNDPVGDFCPSTWRYIKVLSDLTTMFGDLSGFRVVEIGAGYGGQCALLSYLFPFVEYIIFDLPEPLKLQRKFLSKLNIRNVAFLTEDHLPVVLECDLLISNYAITELTRPLADRYIQSCVQHAQRAYITGNQIADYCLSYDEMMSRLPHAVATAETPLTHPDNYILSWRKPTAGFSPDPYRPRAPVHQLANFELSQREARRPPSNESSGSPRPSGGVSRGF